MAEQAPLLEKEVTIQSTNEGITQYGEYKGEKFLNLFVDELQGSVFVGPEPLQKHINNKKAGDRIKLKYRANRKNTGWVANNIDGVLQRKGSGSGARNSGGGKWANEVKVLGGIPRSMAVAWAKDIMLGTDSNAEESVKILGELVAEIDKKKDS